MSELIPGAQVIDVNAQWGPRPETPEALATRWLALVERLQTIDPLLAKWTHWEGGRGFVPFDPRLPSQVARVIDGTTRTRDGRLFPLLGTSIWVTTDPCPPPERFAINMRAGSDRDCNQIIGDTDFHVEPHHEFLTYRLLRGVVLAASETFEATQARVYPAGMRALWTDPRGVGEDLDLAWISYVAPRFAHLVTPPSSVVVEHRPDGGLLMAVTDEIFSIDNPAHLAAAHEIKTALVPYNAVPWTAQTGK